MLIEERETRTRLVSREPCLMGRLTMQPADALLALIGAYGSDPRPDKIDVGVGVYRDEFGATPVLHAVKSAERLLVKEQSSKGYLGPEGDIEYIERLIPIVFGRSGFGGRLSGLQTPGGTGALRLGAELIALGRPEARVLLGTPTWPNHPPIFAAARLHTVTYRFFDPATQAILFDEMMATLDAARAGDVVLLQGCCHNPTGADLDSAQWVEVADVIVRRRLLPLVDLAYQGLGAGLDADARGVRLLLDAVDEALVAYSCDKNFGLYRERTGALFALSRNAAGAVVTHSNLLALARANWSMPPDHGAAIVRTILESDSLTRDWMDELGAMCRRIAEIRACLAPLDVTLAALGGQCGMFSTLALGPEQVRALRETHGIYMAGSGRVNLAGLTTATVGRFAAALADVR